MFVSRRGALHVSQWDGAAWVALGGALNRGADHPAHGPSIAVDGRFGAGADAFPIVLWAERESGPGSPAAWNVRLARANR